VIIALIQARMKSSRLPGKVLKAMNGQPMLEHVFRRVSRVKGIGSVVVVTSNTSDDDAIEQFCVEKGFKVFRGSENDVLDRCYQAAKLYHATTVIRVTGDCPLIDPIVLDRMANEFQRGKLDYVGISGSYTYPDGFGAEVVSFEALERVHREARTTSEREHVTVYIRNHADQFRIQLIDNERYHPFIELHFSVDDEKDFAFVEHLEGILSVSNPDFGLDDVIQYLLDHPEVVKAAPVRQINEGYFKSYLADSQRQIPPVRSVQLKRSNDLLARAHRRIPSCTQTFSKSYTQFVQGVSPVYLEEGKGGLVYDVDGNEYVDHVLGLGSVTLGYGQPDVTEAVMAQTRKGPSFTLPHRLEVELAEKLCEIIPCAEMVRFVKNGSDATSAAVRVARGYTGRDIIACCGYHGWQDWYIGTTTRRYGVPKAVQDLTIPFPYGNLEALQKIFEENPGKVAAVITEPVGTMVPPPDYLPRLKELTHRYGALLIFDEVVTGFRLALGGGQQYFNVIPDLACIGKGMANGFSVSAVVGSRDIMQAFDKAFISFTFAGEAIGLAAALATIRVFERDNVIPMAWTRGRKLRDGYNYFAAQYGLQAHTMAQGLPARTVNVFKPKGKFNELIFKSIFQQECTRRGVLFNAVMQTCLMHTGAQVERTLSVFDEGFKVLQKAYDSEDPSQFLLGKPLEPVFRKTDY